MFKNLKNKKILITGCTGFKGSWLAFWLINLGAKVHGISIADQNNKLFKALKLHKYVSNSFCNVNDYKKLNTCISDLKPDLIFHLAAQSIVSLGYLNPFDTFQTNILGGLNLLEIIKNNKKIKIVYVTSDKCYENRGLKRGYKENDRLGGDDPYSLSKSIQELIFHQYHKNYFLDKKFLRAISVRSGNVIGGGDFSKDRIVPDLMKFIFENQKLIIRNPNSTRPWQHVLEPISGYLLLASKLLSNKINNVIYPSWNFGPNIQDCKSVDYLVNYMLKYSNKKITFKNGIANIKKN